MNVDPFPTTLYKALGGGWSGADASGAKAAAKTPSA